MSSGRPKYLNTWGNRISASSKAVCNAGTGTSQREWENQSVRLLELQYDPGPWDDRLGSLLLDGAMGVVDWAVGKVNLGHQGCCGTLL